MKKNKVMEIIALSLMIGMSAQAQEVRNGGGEDGVFKSIRDEIKVWMAKSSHNGTLTEKLGSSNAEEVRQKFISAIALVGERVIFNNSAISIDGNIRICQNVPSAGTITCNIDAWNRTQGNTRYMIVLHEYLGVAGIESNTLQYSNYPISPKILGYVRSKQSFELGMDKVETTPVDNEHERDLQSIFNERAQNDIVRYLKEKHDLLLSYLSAPKIRSIDPATGNRTYDFQFYYSFDDVSIRCFMNLEVRSRKPMEDLLAWRVKQEVEMLSELRSYDAILAVTNDRFTEEKMQVSVSNLVVTETGRTLFFNERFQSNIVSALQLSMQGFDISGVALNSAQQSFVTQNTQRYLQLRQQQNQMQHQQQQRQQQQAQTDVPFVISEVSVIDTECYLSPVKGKKPSQAYTSKNSEQMRFMEKHRLNPIEYKAGM